MIFSHLPDNALRVQLKHYSHLQAWAKHGGPIGQFIGEIRAEMERRSSVITKEV